MITIIPAIDMIGGQCVRLTQGDYGRQTTYYKDPLEAAKRYEGAGLARLHLVDLDGAKASHPVNLKSLERIATKTSLDIQYGGGIKSDGALNDVFNAGAKRAICGSIAVKEPESFQRWLALFGSERMILGADVKAGKVAINGWLDSSEDGVEGLIDTFVPYGISQAICTDISKDGMLEGPNFDMYLDLQERFPEVEITVSGGISSMDDVRRLNESGLRSVIVGKAIYERLIKLEEIEKWMLNG